MGCKGTRTHAGDVIPAQGKPAIISSGQNLPLITETVVYQGKVCIFCHEQKSPSNCYGIIKIGQYRLFRICKKSHLVGDPGASDPSKIRTLKVVAEFVDQELDKVRNTGDSDVTILLRNSGEDAPAPVALEKNKKCNGYESLGSKKKTRKCAKQTDGLLHYQGKKGEGVIFCKATHLFRYLQRTAAKGDSGKKTSAKKKKTPANKDEIEDDEFQNEGEEEGITSSPNS